MLSVCIPIHNYNVLPLAESIVAQDNDVELVCIDDGSSQEYIELNRPIEKIGKYIVLGENVGRARVRNLFLEHTHGKWLIFLDNDSEVPDDFLKKYRAQMDGLAQVVVGGRIYDQRGNDTLHCLRYRYGTRVESQTALVRCGHPYRSFMTNNFMIRRSLLEQIGFDARLNHYGHEDTLFGYRLEQNRTPIAHIDNAVVNGYVETNEEFLQKTVEGVESLVQIYGFMKDDACFCNSVRLLRAYDKVCKWHLQGLVTFVFHKYQKKYEKNILSGKCQSLKKFNFYKLGTFIDKLPKGNN